MIKLAVVMDPFDHLKPETDSTLAMLEVAASRGYELWFFTSHDLFLRDGRAFGLGKKLRWQNELKAWQTETLLRINLAEFTIILIRKDPPFNLEYLYTSYVLEQAEREGVLVTNKPSALRDANEKLYLAWFTKFCPPTLVTSKITVLQDFLTEFKDIVVKPLDRMGGRGIFRVRQGDENTTVIFETATQDESQTIMAQQYLPAISQGDKRIILIGGKASAHALARIPKPGELRGNLAAGGRGIAQPLSARDKELCAAVGPVLADIGLWFVGLDVIGDYITEINVTSPTGIRELDAQTGSTLAAEYFDFLESQVRK